MTKLNTAQIATLGRNYYRTLARLSFRGGWGSAGDHDYSGRLAAPAACVLAIGTADRVARDGYEVEVSASFGVRRWWQ